MPDLSSFDAADEAGDRASLEALVLDGEERVRRRISAGVEHLLQLDVQLGQGFLLGRPQFGWPDVPAAAAEMLGAMSHPASRPSTATAVDAHDLSLISAG
jgi:hypothetical protein